MKIRRLYINGFGKFRDEVIELNGSSPLIYGGNESGKSTLYDFVRTILFGFPKKRDMVRDYTPVGHSVYGGHILLEHPTYGDVYIERIKDKQKGQAFVRLDEGQTGGEDLLKQLLAPLNLEVFDHVFSFKQEQLVDLNELNETRLQRVLLSVGLTGSARLTNMSNHFLKERQQLFKPTGRIPVLNQKLREFKKLEQVIQQTEEQERSYQHKLSQRKGLGTAITQLDEQRTHLMSQEKHVLEQQRHFPLYLERENLLSEIGTTQAASDVTIRSVKEALQEYHFLSKKEADILERQGEINETESPAFQFYVANQALFEGILEDQLKVESMSERYDLLVSQLKVYQTNKQELYDKYRLTDALLGIDLEAIDEKSMRELAQVEEGLTRDKIILSNEKSRIAIQRKELDDRLNQVEKNLDSEGNSSSREAKAVTADPFTIKMFSGLSAAVAILFLLLAVVLSKGILYIPVIVLLGLAGYGWFYSGKISKIQSKPKSSTTSSKEEYGMLLHQSDDVESRLSVIQEQTLALAEKERLIHQQKNQWATAYGFSMKETIAMWLTKLPVFSQLRDLQANEAEMNNQLGSIERVLQSYQEVLEFAKQWVPLNDQSVRESYQAIKTFVGEQQAKLHQAGAEGDGQWQASLQTTRRQQETTRRALNEWVGLPEGTPTSEITRWLHKQEGFRQNKKRLDELSDQLSGVYDLSTSYQLATINQEMMRIKHRQDQVDEDKKELEHDWHQVNYDIKELEKNGTLDELYQEKSVQLAVIESMTKQWLSVRLAEELSQDVLQFLSDQQLPTLLEAVSNYFKLLTNNAYETVKIKDGAIIVKDSEHQTWLPTQLSTGTKDQLYTAFRLGFIHLHSADYQSPIMIDDGWLHFDDERKETLFTLLSVLSQKTQVICLSSDRQMKLYFEEKQQPVVNL